MTQLGFKKGNNQMGRETISSQAGAWRLLTFMIFVFSVFLISYFGLIFGYKTFVVSQIDKKDKKIAELAAEIPSEQQEDFLEFQFQLINLQNILREHIMASKFFPLLEANIHSQVSLANIDLNIEESQAVIEGVAVSYEALSEQLKAFGNIPEILSYKINGSNLTEDNKIRFDTTLTLSPKLFK